MSGCRTHRVYSVIIGVVATGLAAFYLIVNFTEIEYGVREGAEEKESWIASFGLLKI